MPRSIAVDEDLFELLKQHAEPFVDTPNTVLRRLLGMDEREHTDDARAVAGTLLSEREYELPILRYLERCGGRAPSREVVEAIGEELADRLTEFDLRSLKSGGIRWQKRAAFVRLRLVERGDLTKHAPRGTWEISDKGRERLRAL